MPARLAPSGRARPPERIVHLGLGAFYRAHVCAYLADIGGWGVTGVSLRSTTVRDALAPQQGTYTAVELAPDGLKTRRIEVVRDVLVAPENPHAVIAAMARPQTEIVSLTVTEKGYCHDPATGRLAPDHPDILHDIAAPLPRSMPGFLVRGLQARRDAGLAPFTVMSCDNLPDNGSLTRNVVIALARRIDPDLADWIERNGAFPSSMVDRIVPATTDADLTRVAEITGRHDAAPVLHEPFRQWVIEGSFVAAMPPLQDAGVQVVTDIAPFERMKLRMLNGAHSALAYLGYLAGHRTVSAAVADPVLAAYLRRLWRDEITPTLAPPPGTDLAAYADALLARFANPGIRHATHQIAMDGSQKLPQRLLGTIRDQLDGGGDIEALMLALAGWMRYVGGRDDAGAAIDVRDPLADALRAAHDATRDRTPEQIVGTLLALRQIFDPDLAERLRPRLVPVYGALARHGARAMMQRLVR